MNNVVALHHAASATTAFAGHQLDLIRRTVANDCNPDEFNLFIAAAQRAGLDPLRKQISAIVFNKNAKDPSKRRLAIITTIDGLRAIAARSHRYRPDEDEPQFEYDPDLKGPLNPLGLVKAVVKVYVADQRDGSWRPATGVAYWTEFAPVKDEFAENDQGKWKPTGKQTLEGTWVRMGRVMLAKCAESQALRKAFPEDLSGLYESAEMEQAQVIDLLPSEVIEKAHTEDRLARIGASGAIMFQLTPASTLEPIKVGKVADTILDAARDFDLNKVRWFLSANREPLREFWARSPGDALAVKRDLEALETRLSAEARRTGEVQD